MEEQEKPAIARQLAKAAGKVAERLTRLEQDEQPQERTPPPVGQELEGALLDAALWEAASHQEEALRRFLLARGAAIRLAQQQVEKGSYGICQGCGEAIPARRLEAVPSAIFCVFCQTKREGSLSKRL